MSMKDKIINYITKKICRWFHGGGCIERDEYGRINWHCAKCGRWSDYPVSHAAERRVVDQQLDDYRKEHDNDTT